ncbi:hypothetical protein NRK67_02475 [Fusobacteria bacterium ZRK30]|nr:hypothetical protein NRK67_02475 [Fusobacteria bacterium ZRK30]
MKYKSKIVYSEEHLKEEMEKCEKLGLTFLIFKGIGAGKGAYKITTSEFRED